MQMTILSTGFLSLTLSVAVLDAAEKYYIEYYQQLSFKYFVKLFLIRKLLSKII